MTIATQEQTTTEAESLGPVEDLGRIYRVAAPLDRQITTFSILGVQYPYLVDTQEVAQIRNAGITDTWTRTSVAPVARKGEKTILFRPSPLMNPSMASLAVKSHRNGKYIDAPELYDAVQEIAISEESLEPEDRTAITLSQKGDFQLTPEMPDTQFLLGRDTKEYFDKFGHNSIPLYNLQTDSKFGVMNYLWFDGPLGDSDVVLRYRNLGSDGYALGVLRETAEGSSQNLGYSITDIRQANAEAVKEQLGKSADVLSQPLTEGLLNHLRK
jgi:hypothetical protein